VKKVVKHVTRQRNATIYLVVQAQCVSSLNCEMKMVNDHVPVFSPLLQTNRIVIYYLPIEKQMGTCTKRALTTNIKATTVKK
jgi:hypothetical protein